MIRLNNVEYDRNKFINHYIEIKKFKPIDFEILKILENDMNQTTISDKDLIDQYDYSNFIDIKYPLCSEIKYPSFIFDNYIYETISTCKDFLNFLKEYCKVNIDHIQFKPDEKVIMWTNNLNIDRYQTYIIMTNFCKIIHVYMSSPTVAMIKYSDYNFVLPIKYVQPLLNLNLSRIKNLSCLVKHIKNFLNKKYLTGTIKASTVVSVVPINVIAAEFVVPPDPTADTVTKIVNIKDKLEKSWEELHESINKQREEIEILWKELKYFSSRDPKYFEYLNDDAIYDSVVFPRNG